MNVLGFELLTEETDPRFLSTGDISAEVETLELIAAFIRRLKPRIVVECGSYLGVGACFLAQAVLKNGFGHVYSIEVEPKRVGIARGRLEVRGLNGFCTIVQGDSTTVDMVEGPFGVVFHDGDRDPDVLRAELERFSGHLEPGGVSFIHDSTFYEKFDGTPVRETVRAFAEEHGLTQLSIRSARGLEILQNVG